MKRILTLAAVLVVFGCSAGASDLVTPAATRALADAAMRLVVEDKVSEAFDLLRPQWPLPGSEIDALVQKTVQQRNSVEPRFGAILDYAFVREEKVSDFLVRYTYVERREVHVIRWLFTFYKPKTAWKMNAISWDDNVSELFKR